ncbi:MAG: hypothetical protein AAFQ53_13855 [Bacteroidota bacterium]
MPTPHPIAPPGTKRRADYNRLTDAVRDAVAHANRAGVDVVIVTKVRPDVETTGDGRIFIEHIAVPLK